MKAAIVEAAGTVPVFGDFVEPVATSGRELVSLVAAGIHPVVRSLAAGRHYGSTHAWPLIPGVDAVARTAGGALIYTGFVEAPFGTIAERMAVPSGMHFELPASADAVAIAGGLNPGLSSWMPLRTRVAEVDKLGTVLILGATGVAGSLAVQNAFALGAGRVVGAGRNPAGLARATSFGAETIGLSGDRATDSAMIADALRSEAPSIVIDFVWGSPAEATFAALGRRGLEEDSGDIAYVEIGALAGAEAAVPAALLRSRRIRITGSGAGSASIADLMAQLPAYIELIANGSVTVPTHSYALSRIGEAWAASTESTARAVVVPD